MEAFLLNPGTATQKASPAQSGPAPSGENSGEFSPVMEDAIQSVETQSSSQKQTQGDSPKGSSSSATTPSDDSQIQDTPRAVALSDDSNLNNDSNDLYALYAEIQSSKLSETFTVQQPATPETKLSIPSLGQEDTESSIPAQSSPPLIPPSSENGAQQFAAPTKAESVLLQQIQQIIDQGKNIGSITISASEETQPTQKTASETLQGLMTPHLLNDESQGPGYQPNSLTSANKTGLEENSLISVTTVNSGDAIKAGLNVTVADDNAIAPQKGVKLEGAHQDLSEQYINAKIGDSKSREGKESQQQNQDSKGSEQQAKNEMQAAAQNPEQTLSTTKPVESGFGQHLSTTQSQPTTPPAIEGKLAPGATSHVPQREMVDNLIHRFNVNPRLQTSKLSMHLHPAELGSLKIDILVQGDSIKTNIVAQSQQVMDTLEKNMPRLREVLQSQGFTVDAFEITLESDGGNQKGLFQEHFNSQQQEFTSQNSSSKGSESFDSLFSSEPDSDDSAKVNTGVNLTA